MYQFLHLDLASFNYDTISSFKLGKIVAGVSALLVSVIALLPLSVLLARQLHLSALGMTVYDKYLKAMKTHKN